jgi:hypothetical protein
MTDRGCLPARANGALSRQIPIGEYEFAAAKTAVPVVCLYSSLRVRKIAV